jgi:XTP/dITP diphosphohydrolase
MKDVLLATRNPGKLREYESLLQGLPVRWRLLSDLGIDTEVEETGETFEENARLKALAYTRESGLPTLADDSGLVVDALGGAPGVRSARYAGPSASDEDRYRMLLRNLENVPDEARDARFVCVVAVALPDGMLKTAPGTVEGRITREPRGTGGFGYDPVFWVTEMGCTMAQLDTGDKNRVSHRGRALAALRPELVRLLG